MKKTIPPEEVSAIGSGWQDLNQRIFGSNERARLGAVNTVDLSQSTMDVQAETRRPAVDRVSGHEEVKVQKTIGISTLKVLSWRVL